MTCEHSVTDICRALGIHRSMFYRATQERKGKIRILIDREKWKPMIEAIVKKRPFWGYRRVWAWLTRRDGLQIGKNTVYRIMKEMGLCNKVKRYKPVRLTRPKPRAVRPNQYWGIDMTKFWINGLGWVYLTVVIDWYTKRFLGWDYGTRCRNQEWLAALRLAVNTNFPDGSRGHNLMLISDNGCQPTSLTFLKETRLLQISQIFASYENPKGNADTERFIRTIKEDLIWIHDFNSLGEFDIAFKEFVSDYNNNYVHSTLNYKSPKEKENEYYNNLKLVA